MPRRRVVIWCPEEFAPPASFPARMLTNASMNITNAMVSDNVRTAVMNITVEERKVGAEEMRLLHI